MQCERLEWIWTGHGRIGSKNGGDFLSFFKSREESARQRSSQESLLDSSFRRKGKRSLLISLIRNASLFLILEINGGLKWLVVVIVGPYEPITSFRRIYDLNFSVTRMQKRPLIQKRSARAESVGGSSHEYMNLFCPQQDSDEEQTSNPNTLPIPTAVSPLRNI